MEHRNFSESILRYRQWCHKLSHETGSMTFEDILKYFKYMHCEIA